MRPAIFRRSPLHHMDRLNLVLEARIMAQVHMFKAVATETITTADTGNRRIGPSLNTQFQAVSPGS